METVRQGREHDTVVRLFSSNKGPHIGMYFFRSPISILLEGFIEKTQRPWRFEQLWLENNGCHDIVERVWRMASSGSPMADVMSKIEACQRQLTQWSKNLVCNVSKTLKEKTHLLKNAEAAVAKGKNI